MGSNPKMERQKTSNDKAITKQPVLEKNPKKVLSSGRQRHLFIGYLIPKKAVLRIFLPLAD